MRALITGGGGFIGSHLVDELLNHGHEVRIFDNFSTGDRRNLLHVAGEVEIVEGDLRSFERAMTAARDCEIIFHLAALPSVPRSVQDPLTTSEVNVTGTLNILLAARDSGAQRFIAASSSSVYGAVEAERKHETLPVVPLSPYGVSKLAAEANCRAFWEVYGLETVVLRYFNVFGPRQNPVSEYAAAIPQFIAAALLGEQPTIYGDGNQSRDFTFVDNVVRANLHAAVASGVGGETFNIAMGRTHTLLELCGEIEQLAGMPLNPRHSDPRPGDVRMSLADITKAQRMLGYEPGTDFRNGLAVTYEAMVADETLLPRISDARRWAAAI